ncbi:MAG: nucleotidyltransferase family protein [Nanoarchaeota archaeon]|nr:nucleotidyltransferase family protein [Nanoarchaeota archaeon]
MKLLINTGGKGERLYPLTKDIPKPLVKVVDKPVLHHLVDWAKKHGVNEVVMMNGYKSEKIIEYFGNGENFGLKIIHSNEPYALGSGGAIKFAKNNIDGEFAYISGDLLCAVDFNKMLDFHKKNNSEMTVLVHKSSHPHDSDILKIDSSGKVERFISKHDDHTDAGDLSNAGLCIMSEKILNLMEKEIFTFETYLYPKVLENGINFYGYNSEEFISDMGTFDRLKKCEDFVKSNQHLFN